MAIFSLDAAQRIFLASCITVGLEGADTDEGMEDAMAAILEELEASDRPIELTIMPQYVDLGEEEVRTEADVDAAIAAHGYKLGYPTTSDGRSWGA